MPGAELFSELDNALRELGDRLFLSQALLRRGRFEDRLVQSVEDLHERSGYQERALRPRIGLDPIEKRPPRHMSVAVLEQKGIAVEETPQLIIEKLSECQDNAKRLEAYFKFFNLPKVSEFYRRLRFEVAEIIRQVQIAAGIGPEPETKPAPVYEAPAPMLAAHLGRIRSALAYCPFYFILDESLCELREPLRVAYDAVAGGARIVQLRFKKLGARDLLGLAARVKAICAERGALLIVNDRVDIAVLSGAAGVHLGAEDLSVAEARRLGPELLIGVTARTPADALAAESAGADYIGSGSVYPSPTKPGLPVIGVPGIKTIARAVRIPVVAIGGITQDNCTPLFKAGAAGICCVSQFTARRSVKNLTAQLRKACRDALGQTGE
jgi:thiamine-phosphate pyrophosphorylase